MMLKKPHILQYLLLFVVKELKREINLVLFH